jgi:ribose-phosphate pyrophosphokinase
MIGGDLVVLNKERPAHNQARVTAVIGEVAGKVAVMTDDIIDTAGTLTHAAAAIMKAGASSVSACASHAVFSGKAVPRISESALQHVIVTNTIPLSEAGQHCEKVRVKSVGRLLGEAIKRIHHGDSISSLFV